MLPPSLLAAAAEKSGGAEFDSQRLASEAGADGSDELPTSHDLRRFVQLLVAELERAECSPDFLLKEAMRAVRNAVLLFATRLEHVVDSSCVILRCFETEGSLKLRSPLPMPTGGHPRNARLYGITHAMS